MNYNWESIFKAILLNHLSYEHFAFRWYCSCVFLIFFLKTKDFILQNMFWILHASSSFLHIKSTVNIQIIKGLLECYGIAKNTFKKFYLKIFMIINTSIMNEIIQAFYIKY